MPATLTDAASRIPARGLGWAYPKRKVERVKRSERPIPRTGSLDVPPAPEEGLPIRHHHKIATNAARSIASPKGLVLTVALGVAGVPVVVFAPISAASPAPCKVVDQTHPFAVPQTSMSSAVGLAQSHRLFEDWANTTDLSYALHTQLRNGSARIFAEDIEVARYDAEDVTQEWQWNSFYYPYYIDASHRRLFGNPALIQAVKHRYYALVELSFNYFPAQAYFLAQQMATTRNYDLIGAMPLHNAYGNGHFFLWRSALVAGHGDFTSVAQVQTKAWFKCKLAVCQP